MDKPAYVVLGFDKSDIGCGFWSGIIEAAVKKNIREEGNVVLVTLLVKSYSMEDHQFIRLKVDFPKLKEKEVQVLISRDYVKAIFESKADLSAAFSFAGKASK